VVQRPHAIGSTKGPGGGTRNFSGGRRRNIEGRGGGARGRHSGSRPTGPVSNCQNHLSGGSMRCKGNEGTGKRLRKKPKEPVTEV